MIQPLALQNNVQVVFAWPAQPWLVAADPARLKQIIMTLLGHALSHSGSEGRVQVRCYCCPNGRLRIYFQDTSAGKSTAWLAHGSLGTHIRLVLSQQLAGHMGGVIATEYIANTASHDSACWLELNPAASIP